MPEVLASFCARCGWPVRSIRHGTIKNLCGQHDKGLVGPFLCYAGDPPSPVRSGSPKWSTEGSSPEYRVRDLA